MSLTPGGDGGENVVGYILANRSAVASPAALVQTAKQQNKRGGQQSKHVDTQGYVFLHIILVYFVSAIQEPTVPSIFPLLCRLAVVHLALTDAKKTSNISL